MLFILALEFFILPIIASNDFSARLAPAGTPHFEIWIRFGQAVIVCQLVSRFDVPDRDKISIVVEAAIALA